MPKRYMTIEEVAEFTRLPVNTLRYYRHLGGGKGPKSFRLGARVVYDAKDVEAWIDEARRQGVAEHSH